MSLAIFFGYVALNMVKDKKSIIHKLYQFGKMKQYKSFYLRSQYDLPKKFFSHFYLIGIHFSGILLSLILSSSLISEYLNDNVFFRTFGCSSLTGPIDPLSTVLVLVCIFVHVIRRYFESTTISVYSNGTISVLHYIAGIMFYISLPVIPTVESSVICSGDNIFSSLNPSQLKFLHILGVILFLFASWKQHNHCFLIAQLRKDKNAKVRDTKYYIPKGDMFELISCPHFFMEILIHLSFSLMSQLANVPLLFLLLFVITNQIIAGILNHKWYKQNFPSYPIKRKAIIPYLI